MKRPDRSFGLKLWLVTTLLFVLLTLVIIGPASAQEAAVSTLPFVTNTPQPVPAPVVSPPIVTPPSDSVPVPSWLLQNYLLLLPLLTIGAMLGQNIVHDRSLKRALDSASASQKDAIEAAYEALPESARELVGRGIGIAEGLTTEFTALLKFARDVTDGQPNSEPPSASSPPTYTAPITGAPNLQPDSPLSPAG